MQIDSIEPITKDRSRVKLDTGEKFVLYKGEIRMLKLKPEMELSEAVYLQITKGILAKRSKLRAMNLLKARSYTEYQLTKKLQEAEYPPEIVEQAIAYVKSFGYIDDKQYAVDLIKEQSERRSRKEIYQKLQLKGIARETLDNAFSEVYDNSDDSSSIDEAAIILKTLKKKNFSKEAPYEEKQKLLAYFYRRGFSIDAVYEAIERLED